MGFESAAKAIRQQLHDHYSRTPVAWPNASFEPPGRDPWIRLTILGGDGRQVATAGQRIRRTGVVVVQVFVPRGSGDGKAWSIAEEVAAIFEASTISGIRFGAAGTEEVGTQDSWFQINVRVPFDYDE